MLESQDSGGGQFEIGDMVVPRMKTFVESLSISSGAILIAVLSVGVVWLLCSTLPVALRSLWIVIVLFIFAYSLYWLPVWLGANSSEYSAWVFLRPGMVSIWGYSVGSASPNSSEAPRKVILWAGLISHCQGFVFLDKALTTQLQSYSVKGASCRLAAARCSSAPLFCFLFVCPTHELHDFGAHLSPFRINTCKSV
jgi:hypothetical protein